MMPPIDYLILRTLRRLTPKKAANWMLDRGVLLTAGLDTRAPEQSLQRYLAAALRSGQTVDGKIILVMGYGGSLGIALVLLEAGASHIYLQDPFAQARSARNQRLPPDRMKRFFRGGPHSWQPDPRWVTVVPQELPAHAERNEASVDWVISNSVFEHIADVEANVAACARVTKPGGLNLHHIDLRDHVFKYPFEMLCYSEVTWRRWLNAGSHLNRLRFQHYEHLFGTYFGEVDLKLWALPQEFARSKDRMRPEFLTGDDKIDAVAKMFVEARHNGNDLKVHQPRVRRTWDYAATARALPLVVDARNA